VTLLINRDDHTPELCPVRHILAWIYLLGIKSGYIFPDEKTLTAMIDTGNTHPLKYDNPSNHISYSVFQHRFKSACEEIITDRAGPWGTHSCRKTFYLLGIWGKGSLEALMQDARHKTIKNAQIYAKDASITF
jgi:hypothetical protein